MARPPFLESDPRYKRLESFVFDGPQGEAVAVGCPANSGAFSYMGYAEFGGYADTDYVAVEIEGFYNSEGGVIVPVVSQYQQRMWGGLVTLTMRPLYEVPPYPVELGFVKVILYGHFVTAGGNTIPPKIYGPGMVEIYEYIPGAGGVAAPQPPEDAPCPPRLPWPYRAPEASVSASSEAGRVRRSNP